MSNNLEIYINTIADWYSSFIFTFVVSFEFVQQAAERTAHFDLMTSSDFSKKKN